MQNAASLLADRFDAVLSRLPTDLDLDGLARQTKAIERKPVLETGSNLLRPSLAPGPGGLSLSQTAAWATMLGFAQLSVSGAYDWDAGCGNDSETPSAVPGGKSAAG